MCIPLTHEPHPSLSLSLHKDMGDWGYSSRRNRTWQPPVVPSLERDAQRVGGMDNLLKIVSTSSFSHRDRPLRYPSNPQQRHRELDRQLMLDAASKMVSYREAPIRLANQVARLSPLYTLKNAVESADDLTQKRKGLSDWLLGRMGKSSSHVSVPSIKSVAKQIKAWKKRMYRALKMRRKNEDHLKNLKAVTESTESKTERTGLKQQYLKKLEEFDLWEGKLTQEMTHAYEQVLQGIRTMELNKFTPNFINLIDHDQKTDIEVAGLMRRFREYIPEMDKLGELYTLADKWKDHTSILGVIEARIAQVRTANTGRQDAVADIYSANQQILDWHNLREAVKKRQAEINGGMPANLSDIYLDPEADIVHYDAQEGDDDVDGWFVTQNDRLDEMSSLWHQGVRTMNLDRLGTGLIQNLRMVGESEIADELMERFTEHIKKMNSLHELNKQANEWKDDATILPIVKERISQLGGPLADSDRNRDEKKGTDPTPNTDVPTDQAPPNTTSGGVIQAAAGAIFEAVTGKKAGDVFGFIPGVLDKSTSSPVAPTLKSKKGQYLSLSSIVNKHANTPPTIGWTKGTLLSAFETAPQGDCAVHCIILCGLLPHTYTYIQPITARVVSAASATAPGAFQAACHRLAGVTVPAAMMDELYVLLYVYFMSSTSQQQQNMLSSVHAPVMVRFVMLVRERIARFLLSCPELLALVDRDVPQDGTTPAHRETTDEHMSGLIRQYTFLDGLDITAFCLDYGVHIRVVGSGSRVNDAHAREWFPSPLSADAIAAAIEHPPAPVCYWTWVHHGNHFSVMLPVHLIPTTIAAIDNRVTENAASKADAETKDKLEEVKTIDIRLLTPKYLEGLSKHPDAKQILIQRFGVYVSGNKDFGVFNDLEKTWADDPDKLQHVKVQKDNFLIDKREEIRKKPDSDITPTYLDYLNKLNKNGDIENVYKYTLSRLTARILNTGDTGELDKLVGGWRGDNPAILNAIKTRRKQLANVIKKPSVTDGPEQDDDIKRRVKAISEMKGYQVTPHVLKKISKHKDEATRAAVKDLSRKFKRYVSNTKSKRVLLDLQKDWINWPTLLAMVEERKTEVDQLWEKVHRRAQLTKAKGGPLEKEEKSDALKKEHEAIMAQIVFAAQKMEPWDITDAYIKSLRKIEKDKSIKLFEVITSQFRRMNEFAATSSDVDKLTKLSKGWKSQDKSNNQSISDQIDERIKGLPPVRSLRGTLSSMISGSTVVEQTKAERDAVEDRSRQIVQDKKQRDRILNNLLSNDVDDVRKWIDIQEYCESYTRLQSDPINQIINKMVIKLARSTEGISEDQLGALVTVNEDDGTVVKVGGFVDTYQREAAWVSDMIEDEQLRILDALDQSDAHETDIIDAIEDYLGAYDSLESDQIYMSIESALKRIARTESGIGSETLKTFREKAEDDNKAKHFISIYTQHRTIYEDNKSASEGEDEDDGSRVGYDSTIEYDEQGVIAEERRPAARSEAKVTKSKSMSVDEEREERIKATQERILAVMVNDASTSDEKWDQIKIYCTSYGLLKLSSIDKCINNMLTVIARSKNGITQEQSEKLFALDNNGTPVDIGGFLEVYYREVKTYALELYTTILSNANAPHSKIVIVLQQYSERYDSLVSQELDLLIDAVLLNIARTPGGMNQEAWKAFKDAIDGEPGDSRLRHFMEVYEGGIAGQPKPDTRQKESKGVLADRHDEEADWPDEDSEDDPDYTGSEHESVGTSDDDEHDPEDIEEQRKVHSTAVQPGAKVAESKPVVSEARRHELAEAVATIASSKKTRVEHPYNTPVKIIEHLFGWHPAPGPDVIIKTGDDKLWAYMAVRQDVWLPTSGSGLSGPKQGEITKDINVILNKIGTDYNAVDVIYNKLAFPLFNYKDMSSLTELKNEYEPDSAITRLSTLLMAMGVEADGEFLNIYTIGTEAEAKRALGIVSDFNKDILQIALLGEEPLEFIDVS